jgi:glycosyltransferase involved in cell wall biosynthesis
MDLFLFPSLNEGFGFSLLEAQAAGLHCLVSDTVPREAAPVPDLTEFISLSAGSIYWAAKVKTNLDSPRLKFAPALDDEFRSLFSMQSCVRQLVSIYSPARNPNSPIATEQHA